MNRRDALTAVLGLCMASGTAGITRRSRPILRADVCAEFTNGDRSIVPADVVRAAVAKLGPVDIRDGWDGPVVGRVVSWSFDGEWLAGTVELTPAGEQAAARPGSALRPRTVAEVSCVWPEYTTIELVEIDQVAIVPNPCWPD